MSDDLAALEAWLEPRLGVTGLQLSHGGKPGSGFSAETTILDASWDGGDPFTFPLGAGRVIPGWDQGVPGMKVGGRRQLVIPPDLAYGAQGYPPDIAPNETLVFVVDLGSVS